MLLLKYKKQNKPIGSPEKREMYLFPTMALEDLL